MTATTQPVIEGTVAEGFEPVRDAFVENFMRRNELGGACCVHRFGERVVDLWGGVRDRASGAPWRADTMAIVHSATKGLAAMVMALAHSRGWLDYDALVRSYWPEFGQGGKEGITVRQLLSHQAGLFAFDETVDGAVVADLDQLAAIMARQRPAWEPGERQAYHAISLGFYEGELIRRIDPARRTLGRVFAEEIALPVGIDFYIGVPAAIPVDRIAPLEPPGLWARVTGLPLSLTVAALNPARCSTGRSSRIRAPVSISIPSSSWCGTWRSRRAGESAARAIAKAYGAFASGGTELGLRSETIKALMAPARRSNHGFYDECFRGPVKFSLGFMRPSESVPFGHAGAFGAPGAGGSMGYADPEVGIGYGYVTNRMGTDIRGDPRDLALRTALAAVTA